MPYKSEKIKLSGLQDRRKRLTDEQKKEIISLYALGLYSLNTLAKKFNVSKKTILIIVNPESKAKNDKRIKEHWQDYKPDNATRAEIMREHRQYKHKLHTEGKLKEYK